MGEGQPGGASRSSRPIVDRLLRDAYLIVAVVWAVAILGGVAQGQGDAHIYWSNRLPDPYQFRAYVADGPGYFYSPAFAQLLTPLTALPWLVFAAVWSLLLAGALWLVARQWSIVALAFPPVLIELSGGNVNLLIAVVCVFGIRYPALWALPILTKVTPGVALVWFAARHEWRRLATAVGVTGLTVAVSWLLAPELWADWIDLLVTTRSAIGWIPLPPLPLRVAAAVVLIWWGARRNHAWTIPVGVTLSFAAVWPASLSVLVALLAGVPRPSAVLSRTGEAPAPRLAGEG